MATRIAYAFILLINSIVSWIMLTPWALKKLQHLTLDYMEIRCDGKECHGWVAVHRINFGLGLFHLILALLLLGVKNSRDSRAALQNGFWGPKIILWLAFVVMSFFIPESFFFIYGNYVAFFCAMLFLLLGLILLVDLAHSWAELCLQKIEDSDSRMWRGLLVGSTLGMYLASMVMTILMFIFFARGSCSMNQAAISVNLILFLIISFVSVQPAVQDCNPRAGLAQAAMVTVYCTYLTLSAVSMEPDDNNCNPLVRSSGPRTVTVILGAIVTMATIAYTTTRAATQGIALGSKGGHSYAQIDDDEHGLVTQQPNSRREMRAEALRAAVESGSLPASALDESDDEDDFETSSKDDERGSTQYSYTLFHIIFFLATTWVATLLAQGLQVDTNDVDFAPVGRTYWASWVKIVSSWVELKLGRTTPRVECDALFNTNSHGIMATIKAIEARSVHQIQSGQVITDLCSVAKELVENSLDAGATSIEVRFKNNGLDLIEVQDNGGGISPDNYENVALKHYTSKLSSYDDLTTLHTFGFRGEALSSLCALADFHVVTAQAHQAPKANRLDFEVSGKLQKTQIVAGQKGTTASVGGIFKRLPVRRRELEKNIKREYGKVLNLLHAYACISTRVRFSVRNTVGKTKNVVVFSTNSNPTTKENIANVYGAKTLSALIPLDLELEFEPSYAMRRAGSDGQVNKIQVLGHISRPVFGEGRQTPDRQIFFVNSRPCGLPQIAKAFNEVYKSFNVSQSPFIFADFRMDTSAYDVNVSPDKRTILLHDAAALIESLKTSLAQLFEAADQTVPQSQIFGSKASASKQQALASLPGFVSARQLAQSASASASPKTPRPGQNGEESTDDQPESREQTVQSINRFMSSQDGSSQVDTPSSPTKSTMVSRQSKLSPVATSPEPDVDGTPGQANGRGRVTVSATTEASPEVPEASSQPTEVEQVQGPGTQDSEETPNVVQNAFDRMRPRRMPAEVATITIGGHTVTSMVGSGLPRKRTSDYGSSTNNNPQRKRRIHIPSRPNIFGKHMKAFAAPGTQPENDEEDEDEEDEEIDDDGEEYEDVEAKEAGAEDEDYEEEEAEHPEAPILEPESEDDVLEEPHDPAPQPDIDDEEMGAEATAESQNDLDEAEKKAQEEETVQRLIHQAEETAILPGKHNASRANKMNKGAAHRDATVGLISTIDASVSRLRSQMDKLRESLQPRSASSHTDNTDTDEKTAEDRLSLTVSKADFAQMRIIGQFNLGFILAVRPGDDHDELFIIDQHASDEKFNFERLQTETVVQNQRLVRPQRLDLTAVEEEIVLENRSALEKNGFIVTIDESGDEPIGRRCQLVSLPLSKEVVFGSRDLEELIALLSESPANGISVPRPSKVRKMFAMRACRSSIMIGKTLTTRQMQRVVRNMGTIDKPWNCPHGRPTMRHLMRLGQWEEWDEYADQGQDHDLDLDLDPESQRDHDEPMGLDLWRRYVDDETEEQD
ncbi:DNA mismatch repair protein [Penicillium sp. IBT 16267x]|nr:DNA mismatch repair protein [Penicillium sp. IBT 16267x]